jgi:hypothetical protein
LLTQDKTGKGKGNREKDKMSFHVLSSWPIQLKTLTYPNPSSAADSHTPQQQPALPLFLSPLCSFLSPNAASMLT